MSFNRWEFAAARTDANSTTWSAARGPVQAALAEVSENAEAGDIIAAVIRASTGRP